MVGSSFEREVVKTLEERGFLAFRCRGKYGVDVIGIKKDYIWLIQCDDSSEPITQMQTKKRAEVLKENAEKYGCIPLLAKKEKNGEIIFSKIT